ncbi:DUF1080 domain-containing protein [Pontibacter toksunensis]|uniref:DUF1080 domain-containing protein n=1 Tax=Pontibacter toksunensis TaxID=1332631 RepID=A0ABW6BZY4_9BACT
MKFTTLLATCLLLVGLSCTVQKKEEATDEWVQLFNGKDLEDWDVKINGYPLNENYGNTFQVVDGKLTVNYDQYDDFGTKYGHLFYKEPFSAYLLVMEYRFTGDQAKGGPGWAFRNSGAMLHSQPAATMGLNQDFPISLEAQLLGGNGQDPRTTANLCTPGTNVVMGDTLFTPHCINSSSKTYHGDQWVRVEALVLGDSLVKHIVEGDTVLTFQKPQIGGGSVSNFDPAVKKDGQLLKEGYISLQSESHPIEFRKVELFNLEKYMDDPKKLKSVLRDLQTRQGH